MGHPDLKTIPVILSNLQKAAEKQQNFYEAEKLGLLSFDYDKGTSQIKDYTSLKTLVSADIAEYSKIQTEAEEKSDRGVQRAVRWGQKVTAIQKSLIDRYESKGEALLEGKNLYVCEACGFIFLGTAVPDVCPVCKAPASRFSKIKG